MPQYDLTSFDRGAEAIERKKGGTSGGFVRSIYWSEDKEEKYLLFLNPIEDIPRVDLIDFIKLTRTRQDGEEYVVNESVIARTSSPINESEDAFVKQWGAQPKDTNIIVAVELEAEVADVRGRKRPTGFKVATTQFDRRVRDEDGDLTDETETVVAPLIGIVYQRPGNFGTQLTSYDQSEAPIAETAVKIQKIGEKTNTVFQLFGYPEMPIDLSPLLDHLDTLGYLYNEMEELEKTVTELGDAGPEYAPGLDAAHAVAQVLLIKRLNELCDEDRYNSILSETDASSIKIYDREKKKSQTSGTKTQKSSRTSQRKADEPTTKQQDPDALAQLAQIRERAAKATS